MKGWGEVRARDLVIGARVLLPGARVATVEGLRDHVRVTRAGDVARTIARVQGPCVSPQEIVLDDEEPIMATMPPCTECARWGRESTAVRHRMGAPDAVYCRACGDGLFGGATA